MWCQRRALCRCWLLIKNVMARLKILDIDYKRDFAGQDIASLLERFKRDENIPDSYHDLIIQDKLKASMLRIQEYSDTAILHCTVMQEVYAESGDVIKLYLGGGDVLDVKGEMGEDVDYDIVSQSKIKVHKTSYFTITYKTKPSEMDVQALMPVVFRLTAYHYNGGEDRKVEASILYSAIC